MSTTWCALVTRCALVMCLVMSTTAKIDYNKRFSKRFEKSDLAIVATPELARGSFSVVSLTVTCVLAARDGVDIPEQSFHVRRKKTFKERLFEIPSTGDKRPAHERPQFVVFVSVPRGSLRPNMAYIEDPFTDDYQAVFSNNCSWRGQPPRGASSDHCPKLSEKCSTTTAVHPAMSVKPSTTMFTTTSTTVFTTTSTTVPPTTSTTMSPTTSTTVPPTTSITTSPTTSPTSSTTSMTSSATTSSATTSSTVSPTTSMTSSSTTSSTTSAVTSLVNLFVPMATKPDLTTSQQAIAAGADVELLDPDQNQRETQPAETEQMTTLSVELSTSAPPSKDMPEVSIFAPTSKDVSRMSASSSPSKDMPEMSASTHPSKDVSEMSATSPPPKEVLEVSALPSEEKPSTPSAASSLSTLAEFSLVVFCYVFLH